MNLRNTLKLLKGFSNTSLSITETGTGILMFWSIFSIIIIWELYFEFLFCWFPFYYYFKSIFIILMSFPRLKFTHNIFFQFLIPTFEWFHYHYNNISEFDWITFIITLPVHIILFIFPFHIDVKYNNNSSSLSSKKSLINHNHNHNDSNYNNNNDDINNDSFDLSIPIYDEESLNIVVDVDNSDNNDNDSGKKKNENNLKFDSKKIFLSAETIKSTSVLNESYNTPSFFDDIPTGVTLRRRKGVENNNNTNNSNYNNNNENNDINYSTPLKNDQSKSKKLYQKTPDSKDSYQSKKSTLLQEDKSSNSPVINGVRQVSFFLFYL